MNRREARVRKEYLYRKSLEEKEKRLNENKKIVSSSLENSAAIPTSLKSSTLNLAKNAIMDEHIQGNALSIDDEYANASTRIPKILLTTSRDPSSRLQQFAKEMKLMFPNSQRINRGNHVIPDIVKACKSSEITDLIVLHEHRGIPDGMIVSHFPYGPTAYFSLHNVRLRHDIPECQNKTISEANPHMIFHNFATKLGQRVKTILQHLFPIPKLDSKRVMTFSNDSDFISFRHHSYSGNLKADLELEELGPRFEMRLYEIKLGTIEMDEADSEWSLRPYMNTARKRDML